MKLHSTLMAHQLHGVHFHTVNGNYIDRVWIKCPSHNVDECASARARLSFNRIGYLLEIRAVFTDGECVLHLL